MEYFQGHPQIKVVALFSNKADAYALKRAEAFQVPAFSFTREEYKNGSLLQQVQEFKPDLLVLAGFLWLIPLDFLQAFPNKIINIHPSLLPKFGGKGMHGLHVHQAVIEAKEKESGITIHYVNEAYDQGTSIYQHTCPVNAADTPEQLAARVLELEHAYLPRIIEKILLSP